MTVAGLSSIRHKSKPPALEALAACNCETAAWRRDSREVLQPPSIAPTRAEQGGIMTSLYAMPAELAAPVARGHMPLEHAYAALLASTVAAERSGQLEPYKAPDVFRLQKHLFGQRLEAERWRRALTEHRIARRLKPLIAGHKPFNALFAEAHDVNGTDGFPLEEPEVNELVKTEIYWSLPAGRRSHG